MDDSRSRIVKLSKRLYVLISLIMALFILVIAASVVGTVVAAVNESSASGIRDLLQTFDLWEKFGFDEDITLSLRTQTVIVLIMTVLNFLIYVLFFRLIRRLLKIISEGSTPFTKETALIFRKSAYFSVILFLVYNIFIAIIAFSALMLFSALFEYGAYLQAKADETNRIQEEMIVSFAEITENKSAQTGNHVKRVSEYSRIIAEQLGLPEEECERIRLASTMHDIGRLLIPAEILEKPSRLTDEEFEIIKKHSAYGGELLDNVEGEIMQLARRIALDHHERPDGHGYPDGKDENEISVEGRIVAVADVYDALTSKRSYKQAWEPQQAYDEIIKNTGTQFDSKVIEAFKQAYPKIEAARSRYADGMELSFS